MFPKLNLMITLHLCFIRICYFLSIEKVLRNRLVLSCKSCPTRYTHVNVPKGFLPFRCWLISINGAQQLEFSVFLFQTKRKKNLPSYRVCSHLSVTVKIMSLLLYVCLDLSSNTPSCGYSPFSCGSILPLGGALFLASLRPYLFSCSVSYLLCFGNDCKASWTS